MIVIWVNAFIARHDPGAIAVSAGPHHGKTALPLPTLARVLNPFKNRSAGYLTDQRTFDTNPAASARVQCLLEFDEKAFRAPTRGVCRSSVTTEVDTVTGRTLAIGTADVSRCKFDLVSGGLTPSGLFLRAELDAKASHPLIFGAPDTDFRGTFAIGYDIPKDELTVEFKGFVEKYPSFEGYVDFNGVTKPLFREAPGPTRRAYDIAPQADVPVSARVLFP